MLGFPYSERTGGGCDAGHVALADVAAWSPLTAEQAYEWTADLANRVGRRAGV